MTGDVPRVSPAEAHDLVSREGYVHVDVRTEAEFGEGHPAGAYNVPFQLPLGDGMADNPDFVRVMQARFPTETPIVVGCRSGQRSLRAARALAGAGYVRVVDQRAGWAGVRSPFGELKEKGWQAAGLPAETATAAGHAYAELRVTASG
jgi:rhodanese-related sulfurtransferase